MRHGGLQPSRAPRRSSRAGIYFFVCFLLFVCWTLHYLFIFPFFFYFFCMKKVFYKKKFLYIFFVNLSLSIFFLSPNFFLKKFFCQEKFSALQNFFLWFFFLTFRPSKFFFEFFSDFFIRKRQKFTQKRKNGTVGHRELLPTVACKLAIPSGPWQCPTASSLLYQ